MRNGRDEYWDVVRGMAIVIVVFAHAIQAALHGESDNPLHLVFQSFQMGLVVLTIIGIERSPVWMRMPLLGEKK